MRSTLGSINRQTLLLRALAAGALLTTLTLSPARGHVSTEWGIDRVGGDLGPGIELADAAQCRQACEAEAQCKAYTYVYPGVQGPKGQCYLKLRCQRRSQTRVASRV
jgi:hypothetical protein